MNQESFKSVVYRSLSRSHSALSDDDAHRRRRRASSPAPAAAAPPPSPDRARRRQSMSTVDIVSGLKNGAVDLHDSLAILDKMNAASRSVLRESRRRMPATPPPTTTTATGRRLTRAQTPPAPGNAVDEIKKVIKDSLTRPSLSSASSDSPSSFRHSDDGEHCAPPEQPARPAGGPSSLIAKLIGLPATAPEAEKMVTMSSPRALLDITVMPKPKPRSPAPDTRKAMHFIALLRSSPPAPAARKKTSRQRASTCTAPQADKETQRSAPPALLKPDTAVAGRRTRDEIGLLLVTDDAFLAAARRFLDSSGGASVAGYKLFLDVAEEQFDRLQRHRSMNWRRRTPSLDSMVADVVDGTGKLASWRRRSGTEELYEALEKDLRCGNAGIDCIWSEWRRAADREEEGVARNVGELLLAGLVGDLCVDLILSTYNAYTAHRCC